MTTSTASLRTGGGAAHDQSARAEGRLVIGAFISLFGTLCAQALLETARDALVLTHLGVGKLPWLYLAVAALTLVMSGAVPGAMRGPRSRVLALSLLIGAAITAGLGLALRGSERTPVYLLFLWSGIFSAFTVTQIWTVLAETMDMTYAKRLFGRLAAGGGLGTVAGAALARLLLGNGLEPRHLVLLASAIAAATALAPVLALRGATAPESVKAPRTRAVPRQFAHVVQHPYVARLLVLTLLAAAISTLLDYSLKAAVVAHLSADRLPHFFATFHLATSAVSLLMQLFGVALIVRVVGVSRLQTLLPALLLLGVAATIASGGLAAIVLLRGLDVALRSSFHRTTFELLQVPLGDRLRRTAKPVIDAFGHRAGQAVAGLALLLMFQVAAGWGTRLAVAAVLLTVWLVVALGLGRRYVDLLKSTLRHQSVSTTFGDAPSLGGSAGRQALVAALDSPNETEVRAAVDLLVAYGNARLIAPRLLCHPSPAVVRRVIEVLPFERAGPGIRDLTATLDALLDHRDVTVRKAALLRRAALAPDRALITRLANQTSCTTLRGMSLVILVERGWADIGATLTGLRELAVNGDVGVRLAMAEALAEQPSPHLEEILLCLVASPEPEILAEVAERLGAVGGEAAIGALVTLLGKREARGSARAALTRLGAPAFDGVAAALADFRQPVAVRANAPRALVEIDPQRAIAALLDGLMAESDGFVRFRILRALNRVRRAHRKVAIDEDILGRAAVAATDSAYRHLAWRIFLQDGANRLPERRTPTWALLRDLLAEKEQNAIERLFRVLTLRYPHDGFRKLLRTLRVGGRRTRATGRELIENLLAGPAQPLTLALIDDIGDHEKLAAMAKALPSGRPPGAPTYGDLLAAMCIEEEGGTLAALAASHAAELAVARDRPGKPSAAAATHLGASLGPGLDPSPGTGLGTHVGGAHV